MILGQTFPYLRERNGFTLADEWGANVVHQDLIRACIEYRVVDSVHFFLNPHSNLVKRASSAMRELNQEFGPQRVRTRSSSELYTQDMEEPLVVVDGLSADHDAALMRQAGDRDRFPFCYITHAVPMHPLAIPYMAMLTLGRPHDTIIVTSRAGQAAVTSFLESFSAFASERWGAEVKSEVQIAHLPLGVDTQFLYPRPRAWCREILGLPPQATVALYLGRLTERGKADLEPLLKVFARLAGENAELQLMIAGKDGNERYAQQVEVMAAAFGMGDRVKLVVNFPYLLKPVLYSASDLFISPVDNVQETFGLAVVEAMASGLPVVASDWSGYRDLVLHGETGFLVPTLWNEVAAAEVFRVAPFAGLPEHYLAQRTAVDVEALYHYWKRLAQDAGLRQEMGERGRQRAASEFCWSKVAPRYGELWERQWERLQRGREEPRPRWRGGFDAAFGQFATEVLGGELEVRCEREGERLLRENGELRTPAGIGSVTARRLLQSRRAQLNRGGIACASASCTWETSRPRFGEEASSHII